MTLIERLHSCTGPDRELDAEIQKYANPDRHTWCEAETERLIKIVTAKGIADREGACRRSAFSSTPQYTTSLDAAVSLVPEGWYGRFEPRFYSEYDKFEKRAVLWNAYCIRPRWEEATPVSDDYFDVEGNAEPHNSPAIALCIAALRARGIA